MRPVSLPEVSYGATSVRPDWRVLPLSLRTAIEARLGSGVTAAHPVGGGFTSAFAAVLETTTGDRVFVKAAPVHEPAAEAYAREAAITSLLPPEVPAARPRWTLEADGAFVLCLEALRGHMPELPWQPHELQATLSAWQTAASALRRPPRSLKLPSIADLVREELNWWSAMSAGHVPVLPGITTQRLAELARLERALPPLLAGPAMLHGDLRIDNVLIDTAGKAWLCDWAWPCTGQQWFDTVTLLVTAYASGLDVDPLVDAPAAGVDGALAVLAGHWLVRAAGGPSSASPHHRQHQRFSGRQALAWLAERRGWEPFDLGPVQQA